MADGVVTVTPMNSTIVEGVSDEVLALFTALVALLIIFLISLWNQRRLPDIHPDLVLLIRDFRINRVVPLTEDEINRRIAEARERAPDQTCAICYSGATFPVLTNCGHIFCFIDSGECVNGYWSHSGSLISPVKCAICRTAVTMLLPIDWPREQDADDEDGLLENTIRLDDYNRRFSGDRPWFDYITDLPVLIPYVIRNLFGFNGLMIMFRIRVLIVVVAIITYILSPFDMIPESAYGFIGLLDDVFVAVLMLVYVSIAIRHFLARRGEAQ